MLALMVSVEAAGVKVAVRVRPLPEIALRLPPLTVTSPDVPSQVNVAPGSSLNVKVMVAVSPALRLATLLVIATVGAVVSIVTEAPPDAAPTLPATSVALAEME